MTNRNTIRVEQATVIEQIHHADQQFTLRLRAPSIVERAKPGHFVHLSVGNELKMRRPMSIMRIDPSAATFDVLYKIHGQGTSILAERKPGDTLSVIGPIGQPFKLSDYAATVVLIGGGVGIPPMVFLAEHIRQHAPTTNILAVLGSEIQFPFTLRPSQILTPALPPEVTATMPWFEDHGIPCRLASHSEFAGTYRGYVTELAETWMNHLELADVELFACGPTPMLKAVAELAKRKNLSAQVSLEEYMACAVGGCAGCTVLVKTEDGPAMRRVCVDGPVFDAHSVVFA